MLASGLFYLGLIVACLGALLLLKPAVFLGIHSRPQASLVLVAGTLTAAAGLFLPAEEAWVSAPATQLDRFAPVYQFHEFHWMRIEAPPDRVYRAIKAVRADEILFFRTLVWIRRFGRTGGESILNPPSEAPLLDVATRSGFLLLADDPGREIVLGTAVATPPGWRPKSTPTPEAFRAVRAPRFALATMNFLIEGAGPYASSVSTETRIYATDAATRRRFGAYWRVIYPGSALIRRMWLRAVKRRAESPGS